MNNIGTVVPVVPVVTNLKKRNLLRNGMRLIDLTGMLDHNLASATS